MVGLRANALGYSAVLYLSTGLLGPDSRRPTRPPGALRPGIAPDLPFRVYLGPAGICRSDYQGSPCGGGLYRLGPEGVCLQKVGLADA